MKQPFVAYQDKGVTWIDAIADQRFRKILLDGVPPQLRSKMQEALAATPDPRRDLAHSQRYFGVELETISSRIRPLFEAFDRQFPGFGDWLILTGYTNEYRMVKVFNEWAQMKVVRD